MWSHYSDGYKGYCLKYDYKELKKMSDQSIATGVKHTELGRVNYESKWNTTNLQMATREKSVNWRYEREWRMLKEQHKMEDRFIDMPEIKAIIWGFRASRLMVKQISQKLKDDLSTIEFYRAYILDNGRIEIEGPSNLDEIFLNKFSN